MMTPAHTLHAGQAHSGWDRGLPPALIVASGTTIEMEISDASGGQLAPDSPSAALAAFDMARINPTTGPILVEGAQPGDGLRVRIEEIRPTGWGWTGIIPGFGLLADDFPEPLIHHWTYDPSGRRAARFLDAAAIPIRPFPGTIGVAPAEPGPHSVIPPRRVGGNLDTRDLVAGSEILLPIEVEGALFSLGDTHAAQGDGEVCGTAIESPMTVVVTLEVEQGAAPTYPVFETPARADDPLANGVLAATGIGPDLYRAAQDAVRSMIDLLCRQRRLAAAEAYMLCSVAADLRISEIVDAPNWVVSCAIPKAVLAG